MPDRTIRTSSMADRPAIRMVVDLAFRPEDVVTFLESLWAEGCIIGEWVTEADGGVVAHIVFSRVWIETPDCTRHPAAMLTPLSVHPDWQNQGIGTALMEHALAALEKAGDNLFVVLGHPEYYPRAGFSAGEAADLKNPWQGNPAFMTRGTVPANGTLVLPDAISATH